MTLIENQMNKAVRVKYVMSAYDLLLDAIIFSLFFTLIAQLSSKSMIYVPPVTLLAVLVDAGFKIHGKQNIVEEIEHRDNAFDGSLLTAYEYRGKRNVIVDDLIEKTGEKLSGLRYSVFMNQEGVAERIALSLIMAFIIISIMFVRFQDFVINAEIRDGSFLESARKTIRDGRQRLSGGGAWELDENYANPEEEDKIGGPGGGKQEGYSEGPLPGQGSGIGEEAKQDIYGDPGSANLWGKDLNMQIHPEYGGDVDVEYKGGGRTPKEFELGDLTSAEEYNDNPVKQSELVKKYFEKIVYEGR